MLDVSLKLVCLEHLARLSEVLRFYLKPLSSSIPYLWDHWIPLSFLSSPHNEFLLCPGHLSPFYHWQFWRVIFSSWRWSSCLKSFSESFKMPETLWYQIYLLDKWDSRLLLLWCIIITRSWEGGTPFAGFLGVWWTYCSVSQLPASILQFGVSPSTTWSAPSLGIDVYNCWFKQIQLAKGIWNLQRVFTQGPRQQKFF